MADTFENHTYGLESPAADAFAITPSDGTDLTTSTRGFYVGGSGDVVVDMVGVGTSITFTGLVAGQVYPFRVKRVRSTGTTATGIVGLA